MLIVSENVLKLTLLKGTFLEICRLFHGHYFLSEPFFPFFSTGIILIITGENNNVCTCLFVRLSCVNMRVSLGVGMFVCVFVFVLCVQPLSFKTLLLRGVLIIGLFLLF